MSHTSAAAVALFIVNTSSITIDNLNNATAAAGVCDTHVAGEFSVHTGSSRVATTRGQRAAGQLNQISEVVVLLLWGILAASAQQCVGSNHVCDMHCPV